MLLDGYSLIFVATAVFLEKKDLVRWRNGVKDVKDVKANNTKRMSDGSRTCWGDRCG